MSTAIQVGEDQCIIRAAPCLVAYFMIRVIQGVCVWRTWSTSGAAIGYDRIFVCRFGAIQVSLVGRTHSPPHLICHFYRRWSQCKQFSRTSNHDWMNEWLAGWSDRKATIIYRWYYRVRMTTEPHIQSFNYQFPSSASISNNEKCLPCGSGNNVWYRRRTDVSHG